MENSTCFPDRIGRVSSDRLLNADSEGHRKTSSAFLFQPVSGIIELEDDSDRRK